MKGPGSPCALELRGVTFAHAGRPPCIAGVSLEVREGEGLAVLGCNGSGKTTLLHILDGLLVPTGGTALAFGEPLTEDRLGDPRWAPRFRSRVGLLFQNAEAMLFSATVEEELAFGPLQMGLPEEEIARRVRDVLAMLGIAHLAGRPPARLSAGEQKRVALGAVLALSPSVLLLDEPTSGLDPRSQSTLLEILVALQERGVTTVTATHDLEVVPHIAGRVVVLGEDGRIAAEGSAEGILGDLDLLRHVNLIHAHRHRHGRAVHSHPHHHVVGHDHPHGEGEPLPHGDGEQD